MRAVWLIAPGPLDQRTGGYIYDARIATDLRMLGWDVRACALSGDSALSDRLAACLARIDDGGLTVIDGLCLAGAADILAAGDHAMLSTMIDHVARAPEHDRRPIDDWAACRRRQALRGELSLTVGHVDVAGLW